MTLQLWDGVLLRNSGVLANHADCCCEEDPCWEINSCADNETRYVVGVSAYAVGKYFREDTTRDCWKVVAYHTNCPGETGTTPSIYVWLPYMTACDQCICGCYDEDADQPSTIDVVIANSCSSLNGTYNNLPQFGGQGCIYLGAISGVDLWIELGAPLLPQTGGSRKAIGAAEVFPDCCCFEGAATCGSQTLSHVTTCSYCGTSDSCCSGGTMTITV